MKLKEHLRQRQSELLETWKEHALLPNQEKRQFFANMDQFANPLAYSLSNDLGVILACIINGIDEKTIKKAIDGIIRIRAVQETSPSQAVRFLHDLKNIIRSEFKRLDPPTLRNGETIATEELLELESEIDGLSLRAFDNYIACREQIFKLKLEQQEQGNPLQQQCPSAALDSMPQQFKFKGLSNGQKQGEP